MSDYWHDLMDSQDTNLRKRVVVAPFLSRLPGLEARAKALGLAISQRMEKQGGMVLVEFKDLRQALTQVSPRIENSEDRIVAAARTLGLNTVLSGAVVNLAMQYDKTGIYGFRENQPFALMELDLKLIDVATGVLLAETTLTTRHRTNRDPGQQRAPGPALPAQDRGQTARRSGGPGPALDQPEHIRPSLGGLYPGRGRQTHPGHRGPRTPAFPWGRSWWPMPGARPSSPAAGACSTCPARWWAA